MNGIKSILCMFVIGCTLTLVACNSSSTTNTDNTNSSNDTPTLNNTDGSATDCLSSESLRQQMLTLVNQARSQSRSCGGQLFNATNPVSWVDKLATAAKKHSDDMASNNFFSHVGSNGSQFSNRVQDEGYFWVAIAENISAGVRSPSGVVSSWLNSAGHCANIMNPTYTEMGVACSINANSDFGTYYTQELGTR